VALAFGLTASAYQAGPATTVAVTIPAVSANDVVLVLAVASQLSTCTISSTGTAPTQVGTTQTTSSAVHGCWQFVASGTDSGKVITITGGSGKLGVALASYTGGLTSAPVDQSSLSNAPGGSSATHVCPTVTTVTDQDWIIQALTCKDSTTTSWTVPGTQRVALLGSGAGSPSVVITDGNGPVSLSTLQGGGSFVSGQSVASANDVTWCVALSPAVSGTSPNAGLPAAAAVPPAPAASVSLGMTIQGV
jgi:hypothetical protein